MWMIKRIFILALLLVAVYRIDNLERELARVKSKQPVIIYQVDNAGAAMIGQITDKEIIDGKYTVEAGPYGKFLVTKEQYEEIEIGQEMPEWLKGRGE